MLRSLLYTLSLHCSQVNIRHSHIFPPQSLILNMALLLSPFLPHPYHIPLSTSPYRYIPVAVVGSADLLKRIKHQRQESQQHELRIQVKPGESLCTVALLVPQRDASNTMRSFSVVWILRDGLVWDEPIYGNDRVFHAIFASRHDAIAGP